MQCECAIGIYIAQQQKNAEMKNIWLFDQGQVAMVSFYGK